MANQSFFSTSREKSERLKAHNRRKQFTKMGDKTRIAWLECSDTQLLGQIETALINYFKPKLNGTNNPDASDRLTVY
ncbi:GIY-YIG nuclease family protein [Nostoc sp. 'Peltigera membranacea cyanobiont' N6]|uniref:GIY-YIG nuclease family protein n=1 Tax=Nostoc sp. 'Peltigera membranacea cyanobiont' N6 TaxID=1261031 RepID=UPI002FDEE70D